MDPLGMVAQHGPTAAIAVILAATVWHGMHILRLFVQKKLNGKLVPQPTATPPCAWSPTKSKEWSDVVEDIARINARMANQDMEIARGDFTCAFHGRDEVRDILETLRRIDQQMERLNSNIERLTK